MAEFAVLFLIILSLGLGLLFGVDHFMDKRKKHNS